MTEEELEDWAYSYGLWLCHPETGLYLHLIDTFTRLADAQQMVKDLSEIYPMLRLEIAHRGDVIYFGQPNHERTH